MVRASPDEYYFADQYNNVANVAAHYTSTGPEIWDQTQGLVTHFVAALGTTGTLMGTGSYLRERGTVQLIGVQPAEAFHGIEGLKHLQTAIVPGIFDAKLPDRIVGVETEEAFNGARQLAQLEGIFAGSSTGANVAVATPLAQSLAEAGERARVVLVGCDTGSRYLTTGLWDIPQAE
jgi:cysteine synthase B